MQRLKSDKFTIVEKTMCLYTCQNRTILRSERWLNSAYRSETKIFISRKLPAKIYEMTNIATKSWRKFTRNYLMLTFP
jgi:hypothetical protein